MSAVPDPGLPGHGVLPRHPDLPGDPVLPERLLGPVEQVAPGLLGLLLVGRGLVARIVEVEGYDQDDPASHTHHGRSAANATMFGPPGRLYVYLSHGLHHCGNVAIGAEGDGSAVLLRALAVEHGDAVADDFQQADASAFE